MPRTLLVDTNRSALPIYEGLVARGHEVTVVGENPRDHLAAAASRYVQVDYADVTALAEFVERERFDWLVPGCNDRSFLSCAAINAASRFPGIDALDVFDTINRKDRFRALAEGIGVPVPRVFAATASAYEWPLIVKPVDAFSGRGVTRLDHGDATTVAAALASARAASATGDAIIEEFVEGQLFSHSAFLEQGRVTVDFIVEEHGTANPFAVDTSWVTPAPSPTLLARVRADVERLASALGLQNGLVHTQFILRGDRYWFIEVTRRCPGDLYSLLIEFSTGYRYADAYAAPFIGEALPVYTRRESQPVLRHTVSGLRGSVFSGLSFEDRVAIQLFVPLAAAGDRLGAGPAGRVGILFLHAESATALDVLAQRALRRELYTIL